MGKPRLLDLFSGAGGATRGYQEAGFYVVGVDVAPQPNYCGDEFIQGDALAQLETAGVYAAQTFDAIHASPPCQAHSAMKAMWNAGTHADLVPATRRLLVESGLPYVIENVEGAELVNPVRLCGSSMGLGFDGFDLRRHRLFECSFPVMVFPCSHTRPTVGVYGDHLRDRRRPPDGHPDRGQDFPDAEKLAKGREAMGIDWMNWKELSQAIPPAYTEHIGSYLIAHLTHAGEAVA